MIESVILFMWENETHSVCQRGDEKGWNFRFGKLLYCATESTKGQYYSCRLYYKVKTNLCLRRRER